MLRQVKVVEKEARDLKDKLDKKTRQENKLIGDLEAEKLRWSQYKGTENVDNLKAQLRRAESSRAELAAVLMKILKREGLELSDVTKAKLPGLN